MIFISEQSKKILDKYPNINYKKYLGLSPSAKNLNDLLDVIDETMVDYRDEQDEPLEQFLELERVYDEIFCDNERIANET
ncbi:MAG: hypothetical protein Q4E28_05070 [Clostridia bacterium]|nr:hypothetical protein [Clostridia bacterium]